ncbi:hypothetical protein [Helicobacter cappadocius]|uniref:DUF4410 domain-containing protein n=1 Tax=Helicobacter cappadocius TaxID=3063998 RepID=A0AA90PIY4_9HELI|nr:MULTISPECIES: hypothetical protein [unclassified Helicobacter]MDO7253193.1 hypothetical protein [Helicobacter sp. faydin-H75]MDP2539117.1 hypothetical protein [Helicobacter sp. faydin-H76]
MKHYFFSILALFFAFGCAQIQSPQITQTEPKCPAPLAKIHIESIKAGQNDLNIAPDQIKKLLDENLKDNCFVLEDSDDGYIGNISYSTSLKSSSEEKIASSKQQSQATSEVKISLKKGGITRTFSGKSNIELSGKKILSIGSNANITPEIKNESISKALKAAYESAIKSFEQ